MAHSFTIHSSAYCQALNEIRQGYEAEIAPLVEEERAVAAEMDQLRAKKQALLKEVEGTVPWLVVASRMCVCVCVSHATTPTLQL